MTYTPTETSRERSDTAERASAHTDAQLVEDYVWFSARRTDRWQWIRQHGDGQRGTLGCPYRVIDLCSHGILCVTRELAHRGRLDLLPDPFEE